MLLEIQKVASCSRGPLVANGWYGETPQLELWDTIQNVAILC